MSDFVHLHVHTLYSILDGLSPIPKLIKKAKSLDMNAIAITDHGNMYGVVEFFNQAKKEKVKPILGIEAYVAEGSHLVKDKRKATDTRGYRGYHCILLAKNFVGYQNLCKLSSIGFKDGYYYNPRIDKALLKKYSEGLIASSACLAGEIPHFIVNNDLQRAEDALLWYKDVFGDDFYLELMSHGIAEQKTVNNKLREWSVKHDVKLIATNDVHFVEAGDRQAHDILICINTASDYDDPTRLRYTGQEYLKSYDEMLRLFPEDEQALKNTLEVADKIEEYNILHDVIVPAVDVPKQYDGNYEYLRALTFEGAKKRYGEPLSDAVNERLEYELSVIKKMGFSGYFIIVQDYILQSRKMGVIVGPGRGSAAGSAVAYVLGITDIDPIEYNLLFERFLNPERVSMPDIDVDFDDAGRGKVLDYVMQKYGADHVAQIVTFGTMGGKTAIRDVGRVFKMPLAEVNKLCEPLPAKLEPRNDDEKDKSFLELALLQVKDFADMYNNGNDFTKQVVDYAIQLEGAVRQTGIHACGVIIGNEDLSNFIPLARAKDSDIMVTQYEGKYVESVGMLKMDFLGLKTLSILKDTIDNIKIGKNIDFDLDSIPMNEPETMKLFQNGETTGVFQFESDGMRKYLKDLQPDSIEDLIAMNALYRPGPMDNIPTFIECKQGRKPIEYPHPVLEKILKPTYGIMVYQEQIMQAAQACAGFSLGKADILRRAMGKKKKEVMEAMRKEFIDGAISNGFDKDKANEIFDIMQKFASYGFNRSHSAVYAILAYQSAYLKTHFPAEFMAAVITHSLDSLDKISFFIDECHRIGISVLGPDINESQLNFGVDSKDNILFGLGGIKGVGNAAVDEITSVRKNKPFTDIVDFLMRVNLRTVNRKTIEALASVGAFDKFQNIHRAQFFHREKENSGTFIENLIKLVADAKVKINEAQTSLFGDIENDTTLNIKFPECPEFTVSQKLKLEKDGLGFYLSGHPLDQYKLAVENFTNCDINTLNNLIAKNTAAENLKFACLISDASKGVDKRGNEYGRVTVEDYSGTTKLTLFSEDYLKMGHMLITNHLVLINGYVRTYKSKDDRVFTQFKISEITLLADALDKYTKSVTLYINAKDVDKEYVDKLSKIVKNNHGKCAFNVEIFDAETQQNVKMHSGGKNGIQPLSFTEELTKQHYKFKIN